MSSIDPAILAGSVTGSGRTPDPSRVTTLTSEATALVDQSSKAVEDVHLTLARKAADEARAGMEAFGDSVGTLAKEAVRRGNLGARAAKRVVEEFDRRADDAMASARREVASVGGQLPVLLEDAAAYNMADDWEVPALELVLGPVIDHRISMEMAGEDRTADVPGDTSSPPPPPPPPPPVVATTNTPHPEDYTGPPCPGKSQPSWMPNPIFPEGGEWRCGWPDNPWFVPAPKSPPPASPPPPPASPPPADEAGGQCCPPQQIVVPAPVVNITVGGSPPTSPPPPPPPPVKPEPKPRDGEPPNKVGELQVAPTGLLDGPQLCDQLRVLVAASEVFQADRYKEETLRQIKDVGEFATSIPVVGPAFGGLIGAGISMFSMFNGIFGSITAPFGIANPATMTSHMVIKSINGVLDRWLGIDGSYYLQPIDHAAQYANPLNILSQADTDAAFLASQIDSDKWECLTRMGGNMPWQHRQAMLAKRSRPGITEIVALWYRGLIDDATFYERMRGEGVLSTQEADYYRWLARSVPTVSDIFKYLQKDVFNPDYVEIGNLYDGFDDSWNDQLQRWADANGMSREQIMAEYASSWQDIPTGHLYQMFWRLRPGRVATHLQFTKDDLLKMLKIQEVAPGFREREIAISYIPINRTDIFAAHKAGSMDGVEVRERLMDLGYSPDDADALARFVRLKANRENAASMGAWTPRRIVKEYIAGSITFTQADGLLQSVIVDGPQRIKALEDADVIRAAQGKAACIKSVKKRYLIGEFDETQARQRLNGLSLDQHVIDDLLGQWGCEKASRAKEPTLKMLTDWVWRGIIDWDEFGRRLGNLGYTPDDVKRIRVSTDLDLREKAIKQARAETDYADKISQRGRRNRKQAKEDAEGGGK